MSKPTMAHLAAAAHRLLRYIKSTPDKVIFYSTNNSFKVQAFTNTDLARCTDTRKSITGYTVYLANSLISWKSKKQTIVSKSSAESEYRAMGETTAGVQWILYFLHGLNIPHPQLTLIYTNNSATYCMNHNPVLHEKTKHINIDCHYNIEKIKDGTIKTIQIPTEENLVDVLTKPQRPSLFQ